jgi:hypothetical protein
MKFNDITTNIHTEYLVLYIPQGEIIQWGYHGRDEAKRLVCPVQSISFEKLHAGTLSPSGLSVEKHHLAEPHKPSQLHQHLGLPVPFYAGHCLSL